VVLAIAAGLFTGKVVSLFGKPKEIYNDFAEFHDAE
jgi:hypothetical protein